VPHAENTFIKESSIQENRALERIALGDLHQRLLEQYAPPSIIVNENYDVVHISEKAGKFLHIAGGEPSNNILNLIKPALRLELRTALYQAMQKQINVDVRNLAVEIDGKSEVINLHVRPVVRANDTARGFMLLIFEPSEDKVEKDAVEIFPDKSEPLTLQLEKELTGLKTQLRSSNEQFEIQTEELKASNEELQAMNEELRSAAEELETSKEELQSINEELITVNQELKIKIEEVSQSNNDFQNLINSTNIGTVFLDRYFRVKLFTPASRDIFNLIPADIGRPLSDITSGLEYDDLLTDAENVLQKLQTIEREVSIKEGRTYLMQVSPYRTAEDRISGVVLSFVNITERKKAVEGLRSSEERLRLLIKSAKDYAIFSINLNRCIDTWNPGAENMFKYAEEEIKGKLGDILFTPEDQAAGAPEHEADTALKTGLAMNERWHMRKDGSYFYGSGSTMPVRDKEGKAIGFVKIMRDLTESKKAEEALHASEERLRMTIDSVTDYAIINTNTERLITGWNTGAERIFEYKAEEVIGKPVDIIFTPEDIAAGMPIKEMQTAIKDGLSPDERWHIRRDGTRFYMSGVMRPILNPDIVGFVKIARDMTEQKLLEQNKDDFIAIASHELRTPLTSIKAYTEMLCEVYEEANHADKELAVKLNEQVDRLVELVRSLLDTTKLAQGQLALSPERFNLDELIQERVEELKHSTGNHQFKIVSAGNNFVNADKKRIGEVISNLISNAIKYSPKGGEVIITTKKTSEGIEVSVHDNGIGIPEDVKNKIFERFFRVNANVSTFPGLGLGLYIAAIIIQQHGGRIWLDTAISKGSTFNFVLPNS
ncbi:MAG TPA: PAS domain S-box protein, partial [Parafilimonas sp.]|nr:PAS domain S-box protein [Parafilimonas sp.]